MCGTWLTRSTYGVLWYRSFLLFVSLVIGLCCHLSFYNAYGVRYLCFHYRQGPAQQFAGHLHYYTFDVLAHMLAVIGLHYGIGPYGLPRRFYEIAAQQTVCPHGDARVPLVVATLVHARGQANVARQMFYVAEPPQVAKFADDAAGYNATYARNAAQQIVVLFVMLATIGT